MINIAILGAGQIGQAVYKLLQTLISTAKKDSSHPGLTGYYIEQSPFAKVDSVHIFDIESSQKNDIHILNLDLNNLTDIAATLQDIKATHVINTAPFFLNVGIAQVAASLGCSYFDFTEDDSASKKVQDIYKAYPLLTCATKCGLAPGFINYVGVDLISKIEKPKSLKIAVGALPRNAHFSQTRHAGSYALTWSVDGLVNEYIRPCHVRLRGKEVSVEPLTNLETLILDGIEYEMAFTSGGIGSLVNDLPHVPNVSYSTIRYPKHYEYVKDAVRRNNKNFESLKREFLHVFPYTRNDVIVVFAEAAGYNNGHFVSETYSDKFIGANDFTAIQLTTATGGLAVLEMVLNGYIFGIIKHSDITATAFRNTIAYKYGYIRLLN